MVRPQGKGAPQYGDSYPELRPILSVLEKLTKAAAEQNKILNRIEEHLGRIASALGREGEN